MIIANCNTNASLKLKDTKITGIKEITLHHIENAAQKGNKIKLIGKCIIDDNSKVMIEQARKQ